MKTSDGGINWIDQSITSTNGSLNSVFFINKDTGFTGGHYGSIFRTTNGGQSWSERNYIGPTFFIHRIFFPDDHIGYAAVHNSTYFIYKSTDTGYTWFPINFSNFITNIFFTDSTTG